VTPEQIQLARQMIDMGTSISAAARALGVSRASLNRGLDRLHLSNRDVKAETAAMKLQLAAQADELEQLRAWRDDMMTRVLAATGGVMAP
jgi:transposase-like protein